MALAQLLKSTLAGQKSKVRAASCLSNVKRQASPHWLSLSICFSQLSQSVISDCTGQLAVSCQMGGLDNDHSGFPGGFLLWVKVRESMTVVTVGRSSLLAAPREQPRASPFDPPLPSAQRSTLHKYSQWISDVERNLHEKLAFLLGLQSWIY